MNYIALDIGNVLCTVDVLPFLDELSHLLKISLPDAGYFLKRFQKLHDLGYTSMEEELRDKFRLMPTDPLVKQITASWNTSVTINFDVLNRLNDFKKQSGLKIALLSNIGVEHAIMMKKSLDHNDFLTGAIKHFSCDVGARKPSYLFYQSFLMQHREFTGCLYVDDLHENLEMGTHFGFRPYHMDLTGLDAEEISIKLNEITNLVQLP